MSAITVTILSQGKTTNAGFGAAHIDVYKEVNRIPTAQITLADGDIATRRFDWSQHDTFALGNEIEIKARYEGGDNNKDTTLFKGIVVSQRVEAGDGYAQLVVELRDKSVKMCGARHSVVYTDKTDSDIIKELINAHGLSAGKIKDTGVKQPEIVQYDCSDWDFMLMRAEANGLLVYVEADGSISLVNTEGSKRAAHLLEFGMSEIYALEMAADMSNQVGNLKTTAWDSAQQDMTAPENGQAAQLQQGNLNPQKLSEKAGAKDVLLATSGWRHTDELGAWANSRLVRNRLALFRGWIAVAGHGNFALLDTLEIKGISDKFNGKNFITGVRHQISPGRWRSDLQFGLSDAPFVRTFPNAESLSANGLLPSIQGLHIGVVDNFEEDPDGLFRVRVRLPTLESKAQTVWARQLRPDAGDNRGLVFYPEVGDELVIGFLNGDPREAIIVGSLHSSAQKIPSDIGDLTKENAIKGFFTKNGLQIKFDDKAKSITIQTAAGKKIVLDDDAKSIKIEDDHNNQIILDGDGITLKSGKDVKIEASGKIEIKGSTVDIK